MYFLKCIIADKLIGLYQPNVESCGWGWGRDSIGEHGNQNKEK